MSFMRAKNKNAKRVLSSKAPRNEMPQTGINRHAGRIHGKRVKTAR